MTHVRGTIHGKLIELSEETGLPDGQEVTVFLQPTAEPTDAQPLPPGEGLRRAYGAWAEDAERLDSLDAGLPFAFERRDFVAEIGEVLFVHDHLAPVLDEEIVRVHRHVSQQRTAQKREDVPLLAVDEAAGGNVLELVLLAGGEIVVS